MKRKLLDSVALMVVWVSLLVSGCSTKVDSPSAASGSASTVPSSHHAVITIRDYHGLPERVVTYNLPKRIAPGQWLVREVYFTGLPGAPTLVLRMPCTRRNRVDPPHMTTETCQLPKITQGSSKGMYVSKDGEIIPLPPH